MKGISLRRLTFMFLAAFLVWSSSIETCIARKGKHWRQRSHAAAHAAAVSLIYAKSPPHKTTTPSPKAKAPPSPKPRVKVPSTPPPQKGQQSKVFDVLHFGAKGDGKTDDTKFYCGTHRLSVYGAKAFQAAWAAACKVEASTVVVPAESVFLVGPISFSGPYCQANIVFQGKGIIDGRGSGWWQDAPYEDPYDDEKKLIIPLNSTVQERPPMPVRNELSGKMPNIKPTVRTTLNNEKEGHTIQNSPQCHLKFDNCIGVVVHDMTISSPGDSPNTDGIHLQNSKDVLIHGTNLACGHGISIGSLGKDNTKACVSNITVRDIIMHNTMNGVRIKTWQVASKQFLAYNFKSLLQGGSGNVQGVLFSNIQVSEVQLPIVIDQFCDKELLKPLQERYHLYDPFCWQTFGELTTPTVPPIGCLQIGKPSNNRVQSAYDVCQV
ncbi:Helicase-like protein [Hibiscus syriacus]|uniref:Helicase-like protein n=1 Tax=Hibiscus syriacus TaxID=106335 RepID=A0A6A2W988_HIBSY|nr:Helicase-like protein [Hibiscus syriacus]